MSVELDSPWSTAPGEHGDGLRFFPFSSIQNGQKQHRLGCVRVILSNDALQTVVVFTEYPFRLRVVSFGGQHLAQHGLADQRVGVVLAQSPLFDGKRLSTQLFCFRIFPLVAKHIGKVAGGHQRGTVLRTQFFCFAGEGLAEHLLCLSVVFLSDEGEPEIAHIQQG